MDFASPWPTAIIICLLLILARTPVLRAADTPPKEEPARVNTIDGLRGFLALGVFCGHSALYHEYIITGVWNLNSAFYADTAQGGVCLFFMITGFLFWSMLMMKQGKPNWIGLYCGRIFRIMPLYWFAITLVVIGVIAHTGVHLVVSHFELLKELVRWGAGGLVSLPAINGYKGTNYLIAGVVWTLGYEWKFYFALLPISVLARWRWASIIGPAVALATIFVWVALHPKGASSASNAQCAALFLTGMTVAALRGIWPKFQVPDRLASFVVLALIAVIFVTCAGTYAAFPIAVLGIAFFLIASGTTVFGLLSSRSAKRLGNISFGIYLLQGAVLAGSFAIPGVRDFARATPTNHWIIIAFDSAVLVGFATVAHALIERPGIDLGKFVAARITRARSSGRPKVCYTDGAKPDTP